MEHGLSEDMYLWGMWEEEKERRKNEKFLLEVVGEIHLLKRKTNPNLCLYFFFNSNSDLEGESSLFILCWLCLTF